MREDEPLLYRVAPSLYRVRHDPGCRCCDGEGKVEMGCCDANEAGEIKEPCYVGSRAVGDWRCLYYSRYGKCTCVLTTVHCCSCRVFKLDVGHFMRCVFGRVFSWQHPDEVPF
jgi:hypothetical protein